MLSTIHGARDHRIFHKEAVSLSKEHNLTVIALGEHDKKTVEHGINIIEYEGKLTPINHLINCANALKTSLFIKSDVYHCHEPSSLFLGCVLKMLKRSKLVYDRHDYYPTLVKEKFEKMGLNKISGTIEYMETLSENAMIKYFVDKLIVVDEEMDRSFCADAVIHNYSKGIKGTPRDGKNFSYIGVLDHRKLPESIKIFRELIKSDENIKYSIAGNVFDKSLIPDNEFNIEYFGAIPHDELTYFLNETSFGICFYDKLPRYENAVSTKTYEYIASGIPVIASRTYGNQFIEDYRLGVLIDPDNIEESVEIIKNAIPRCSEMSKNCLNTKYKWEEDKLLYLYRGIK